MEFELMWREEGGSWEGFTVPSYRLSSYNWSGKYAFTNLKPATRYEARVAAENSLGWSRPSPTFHFATFGAGKYTCQHMDDLQHTVWKIQNFSATPILREIKHNHFKGPKNCCFGMLQDLNFDYGRILALKNCKNSLKSKCRASEIALSAIFDGSDSPESNFT